MYYILDGKSPVPEPDLMKWGRWFEKESRIVEKTQVRQMLVSTVFLGFDHGFDKDSSPVLFETMVFGGPHDGYQERYCTWDQAVNGHWLVANAVLNSTNAPLT